MIIQDNILTSVTNEDIIDGHFVIPNGIQGIGDGAFRNCTSLQQIALPASLRSIGNWAFWNCTSLQQIVLPASLEKIGNWAFQGCTSLASIVLPEVIENLGIWAFNHCTSLNDVQGSSRELVNVVKLQALTGRMPPSEKMIEWNKLANK